MAGWEAWGWSEWALLAAGIYALLTHPSACAAMVCFAGPQLTGFRQGSWDPTEERLKGKASPCPGLSPSGSALPGFSLHLQKIKRLSRGSA